MSKRATARNIKAVLAVIIKQCDDTHDAKWWAQEINRVCDRAGDFFGTEGQNDPRGDQRQ
jgi:hypothetical protein